MSFTPWDSAQASSSCAILSEAHGSTKLAIPTDTQVAPARINSAASSQVMTPPAPLMGISTAWATSQTMRTAMWWHSGPERPPLGLATRDLRVWDVDGHALDGVDDRKPSGAAASRALGDLGDVDRRHLHEHGLSVTLRQAAITEEAPSGVEPMAAPPAAILGQLTLIS